MCGARKTKTNCKYTTFTYSCVVVAQTPNTTYNSIIIILILFIPQTITFSVSHSCVFLQHSTNTSRLRMWHDSACFLPQTSPWGCRPWRTGTARGRPRSCGRSGPQSAGTLGTPAQTPSPAATEGLENIPGHQQYCEQNICLYKTYV